MARPQALWRPPAREGVSASRVAVPSEWAHQPLGAGTVLDFLSARLSAVGRSEWAQRLAAGDVLDAAGQPLAPDAPAQPGACYWYWRHWPDEVPVPFEAELLYRDAHLLVVDKPHFLPMTPKGRYVRHTLQARLQQQLGLQGLTPLHRLDRETAGVVLFGLQPTERAAYQALFRERAVRKVYEAVAAAPPPQWVWPVERSSHLAPGPQFPQMLEWPDRPPNAHTQVTLLAQHAGLGLYQLAPLTGQTHQLRVHMNALGLPLLGDRIYPRLWPEDPPGQAPDYRAPLQLLARRIAFDDPVTGQPRVFESRRTLAAWAERF